MLERCFLTWFIEWGSHASALKGSQAWPAVRGVNVLSARVFSTDRYIRRKQIPPLVWVPLLDDWSKTKLVNPNPNHLN